MDQSSSTEASSTAPQTQNIKLNILSPSSEIPGKLTFNDCPTSTTVAELKARICNAVATRPAPERQRLIYRGKPLVQENATLQDVLSQDAIANSSDHSLHLVLPPTVAPQSSNPSSLHSQPTAQRLPHPVMHQPGSTSTPPPGQRGMPQMHFPPPHGHGGPVALPPGQFPPHLQQALNNHLQALNQQIAAQMASHSGAHLQAQFNSMQTHGPQNPQVLPQSFQQVIAQQQQARAAAGLQGIGGNAPGQTGREPSVSPGQEAPASAPPVGQPIRASTPTNVNTVVRENQGPHGESWRMVIQSTSTVTAPNPHLPRVPTPVNMGFQGLPGLPVGQFAIPNAQQGTASTSGQLQARLLEHEMFSIQSALARGTIPAPSVFENARTMLRNVEANEGQLHLRSRLDQLSAQADQQRANLNNSLMRVVSDQPAPASVAQRQTSSSSTSRSTDQSSLYLLSSPSGPQALLVSPQGTYSTPWHVPTVAGTGFPLIMQQNNLQPASSAPSINVAEANPQNPPGNAQPLPQQQQQQHGNEARDLLRLLIPLGGHIWLLIRLFGFVYFFTAGGGSRRAILLGAFAFLVFIAQTGVFRPVVQAIWDPLRRHVEGLLPVPGNPQAPARNQEAVAQHPPAPSTELGAARRDVQPSPQEAAARLLQERERRDTGVLREQIRRVERAVALFVGSLVPGFGERQIAARDAAEAIKQAEERQREEAARREEEDRNALAAGDGSDGADEPTQETGEASRAPDPEQRQSQGAQAPLVEI